MNGPIPLPAVPARGNRGARLPLTPLPIAPPKRGGVPRFGPQSRPAVRCGRTRTARITESGANRPVPDDPEQKTPRNPAMEALPQPSPYLHPSEEAAPPPPHISGLVPPRTRCLSRLRSATTSRSHPDCRLATPSLSLRFDCETPEEQVPLNTLPTVIATDSRPPMFTHSCPNLHCRPQCDHRTRQGARSLRERVDPWDTSTGGQK